MNGLGNDFVVLDARRRPLAISDDQARAIAQPIVERTKAIMGMIGAR